MSSILLMELNKHSAVYGTLLQVCVCEFISPFPAICSGECVYIGAEGGWAQGGWRPRTSTSASVICLSSPNAKESGVKYSPAD